ncbi:phage baseplate assembly protein V [Aurantimonas sp. MSK8Z-1]|uniref:phage baseplate assembly protein V n=1 Tax=Mangrovibrevibacter kandeliae TaxID=2968473 RepID=UPI0021175B62|nr:phage baseplate assembly protein V [Aurantimonas sp. MSK8Z-1]MCW4114744.1 phage baseplate assembly protein V [Aurantimonas sp. MSK8Z-1]
MAHRLADRLVEIERRLAEHDRRNRNRRRLGTIVAVKAAEGLYRVQLKAQGAGGRPYLSPWLAVKAPATGGVKIQAEPTMGQQVAVVSESGDLTDAIIDLSVYDTAHPRPHDKNGELKITVSGEAFSQLVAADGSVRTRARARIHDTDEDVVFNTGGIVRFT